MTDVPPTGADRTIARHRKGLDWLKAELVGGVAALFKATAQLQVPLDITIPALQENLESLAQDLMVDIALEDISPKTPE